MLENQYCNQAVKKAKNISDVEFELEKTKFLSGADGKIILFALEHLSDIEITKPLVVSEETKSGNDGKIFKKIPEICDLSDIPHCTLQELLKDYFNVDMIFNL